MIQNTFIVVILTEKSFMFCVRVRQKLKKKEQNPLSFYLLDVLIESRETVGIILERIPGGAESE